MTTLDKPIADLSRAELMAEAEWLRCRNKVGVRTVLSLWKGNIAVKAPARSMREIATEVAERHQLTLDDLKSQARVRRIAWARQEAMYEIHHETSFSYPRIGQFFGGRDHTTAMYSVRAYAKRLLPEGLD